MIPSSSSHAAPVVVLLLGHLALRAALGGLAVLADPPEHGADLRRLRLDLGQLAALPFPALLQLLEGLFAAAGLLEHDRRTVLDRVAAQDQGDGAQLGERGGVQGVVVDREALTGAVLVQHHRLHVVRQGVLVEPVAGHVVAVQIGAAQDEVGEGEAVVVGELLLMVGGHPEPDPQPLLHVVPEDDLVLDHVLLALGPQVGVVLDGEQQPAEQRLVGGELTDQPLRQLGRRGQVVPVDGVDVLEESDDGVVDVYPVCRLDAHGWFYSSGGRAPVVRCGKGLERTARQMTPSFSSRSRICR